MRTENGNSMFDRDKREMPVVDSATPGVSPGAVPFSATASSRKEKKKQAKEERDRMKQAEKKKRRLEKALATAAAIRTELEKKKQRRKEEEQRLDEEGAALAEAVALQVSICATSALPAILISGAFKIYE